MVNMKKVLIGLLGIVLMVSVGCGKSMVAETTEEDNEIAAIKLSPKNTTLMVGGKTKFTVDAYLSDGSYLSLKDQKITQSTVVGVFDANNNFTAKYPGKAKLYVTRLKNDWGEENKLRSAGFIGDDYEQSYVEDFADIEILPNAKVPPLPPQVEITEQKLLDNEYLLVKVYRTENMEGVRMSFGSDELASQISTTNHAYKEFSGPDVYNWYEDENGRCYTAFTFYYVEENGSYQLDTNKTYYIKFRGMNCYGDGEWSEVKVLSKGTNAKPGSDQQDGNILITPKLPIKNTDNNVVVIDEEPVSDTVQLPIDVIINPGQSGDGTLRVTVYGPDGNLAASGEVWVYIWTGHIQGVVPTNIAWERAHNGVAEFTLPAGEYGWSADLRDANGNMIAGAGSMYQNYTVHGNTVNVLDIYLQTI